MQVLANLDKTVHTSGQELLNSMERNITLGLIDDAWKEHLRAMDDLKQSVQTASYEQKDPLVIYKQEAYLLFKQMDSNVNAQVVSMLCHAEIPMAQTDAPALKEGKQQKTDMSRMQNNKQVVETAGKEYGADEKDYYDPSPVRQEPLRVGPKVGRNDACPCGSGKKYKNCHGREE